MSPFHRIPRTAFFPAVLAVCALLTAVAGCSSATGVEVLLEELDRAEQLWTETRPSSYEAETSRDCECLPAEAGPVLLEISVVESLHSSTAGDVEEEIVGGVYLGGESDGTPVPEEILELFLTAEGLFALVRRAIEEGAHSVSVEYDGERGYPRRVGIDWDPRVADEESYYHFEVVETLSFRVGPHPAFWFSVR